MAHQTTDYLEIQQNEIDALHSIFMEDFVEEEVKAGAWNKTADRGFRLRLRAPSDKVGDVSIELAVSLPTTYPKSLPRCHIKYDEGVRQKTRAEIEGVIKSKPKALLGSEMIFELATSIQDALEDSVQVDVQRVPTLDEERAIQEAEAHQKAEQAQELERRQQMEAALEEERLLVRMVEQEQSRLAKLKLQPTKTPQSFEPFEPAGDADDTLSFDREITTKDPKGFVVAFRVVRDKVEYRRGPITDVYTVRPKGSQKTSSPYLALKQCTLFGFKQEDKFKKAIQSLESDLEALMQLAPHPSILRPLNFRIQRLATQSVSDTGGWSISILTELVGNGSMADLLGTVGTLQVTSVRSWVIQIIEGLDFYHRHKVVHGALNLQNILLERTESGPTVVKLCDGLFQHDLHLLNSEADNDYLVAASAYWIAPEISKNTQSKPSSPTDIWDLGVVFLQMLFGLEIQRLHASPTSLMEELDLSYTLADILAMIFRADSRKRPTAFDLLPHEFLRNDDPVLNKQTPLSLSNVTSSASLSGTRAVRTRHDSTNIATSSSRYSNDFVEAGRLGKGGFGEVVRARNKLDSRIYAIKKITQTSASALSGVLSEVILLSQLNHPNVVRYYTAWIEDEGRPLEDERKSLDSETTVASQRPSITPLEGSSLDIDHSAPGLDFISSSGYPKIEFGYESGEEEQESDAVDDEDGESDEGNSDLDTGGQDAASTPSRRRSSLHIPSKTTLYIQMEYCERQTLRDLIKGNLHTNPEEHWRLFRQILEGLSHVHSNGIIHRDLKPDNLFIDSSNNIKIGDFGLARPGDYHAAAKARSVNIANPALTRSIGTSLYVAPEVKSTGGGNYNEKADMFSLGIIFFEMSYPLKTAMERVEILEQLRCEKHTLPSDFEKPEMSTQGDIINSLLKHRPSERPSSTELLRSGKVPFELEDETIRIALQGIADTTSPYYAKLMSGLFTQTRQEANVKDHTYDTLLAANTENYDGLLRCLVRDKISAVFRRHGAVEQPRPLLLPSSAHYSNTAVRLLNSAGTLVQLPYDLTLPNARMLAKQLNCGRKTFAFADVYRENPTGGHPKRHGEVDFDIVSYDNLDLALREAEVLKVIDEILDITPSLASVQMCYHINHSQILDYILDFCDVVALKRPAVKEIISKLNIGQWTWPKIRNELRAPSVAIPSTSLDELMLFDFRDTYDKAIPKLRSLLRHTEELESTFSHLQAVTTYLLRFSVKRKVYISPLSSFNDKFYRGNILFQCVYDSKKRDVFAAGGRYDRLIVEHRSNPKIEDRHAVGFNLGWERLLTSMARYQKNFTKSFLKEPGEGSRSEWAPRRCDVLVDSLDPATLRSTGLMIVQELWANDISAELVIDASSESSGRQESGGETAPHSWIVIVKQDDLLKVRSARREDHEIRSSELVGWLRSEMRERDRVEGKTQDRTRLLRQTSSHPEQAFNDREADVRVLVSQTRGKKTNRRSIIEEASSRTQELVHGFLDGPVIAIETKDDIFEGLRDTRLSDPDSWRRFIQSAPLAERQYLSQVLQLLIDVAGEARVSQRNAFIYNFRTRACIYYDLGKPP